MRSANALFWRTLAVGAVLTTATSVFAQAPAGGRLVVAVAHENALVIIDPSSGKVLGRAAVDDDAHEVGVSADGKLAFSVNGTPSTISVVDLASRKELRRVQITGRGSHTSRVTVAGGKVYFASPDYKLVGCYDPANDKVAWLIGTGEEGHIIAVTPDGDKMFVTNREANSVSAIYGLSGGAATAHVTNIPVSGSPEGLAISPDGREAWVALRMGAGVIVIDVATKKMSTFKVPFQALPRPGSKATRLAFTPDGKRVLLLNRPSEEIVVLDAVARKEIKRLKVAGASVLMASDGSHAYVSVQQTPDEGFSYLTVIDMKTLEVSGKIEIPPGPPAMCSGHCDTMAMAWAPGK